MVLKSLMTFTLRYWRKYAHFSQHMMEVYVEHKTNGSIRQEAKVINVRTDGLDIYAEERKTTILEECMR